MMLNITFYNNELDSNFFFNSTSFKIFHGIASIFFMLIAFFSYSGFIHYEYYGADPMKRSIKNKLVAQICKALFIYNILVTPVFTWRILIGPVNENLSTFTIFIRNCNGMIIPLCFTEIIAFRFLMLFGWKHFNTTNEDLMFAVINMFNTCIVMGTQISRWMLGKIKKYMQKICKINNKYLHARFI